MPKKKSAAAAAQAMHISVYVNSDLHESFKLLAANRKAASKAEGKPSCIKHMLDEGIYKLNAMVKTGADVAFIPLPPATAVRTSMRISVPAHKVAIQAARTADVKFADFVRTAMTLYARSHAGEIYANAQAPTSARRRSARR